jgi:predicted murein hydrolase (TIGR00659 family)
MSKLFESSVYAGVAISLVAYVIGSWANRKTKLAIVNPILIAIALTIVVLSVAHVDYETYNQGAKYLSWFMTPATVCLAIPLYEQWMVLKKNWKAVLIGILTGVVTSLTTVLLLCRIMGANHKQYVTLLPKSVTTPIGMGISEELDGYVTITVAVIVVTGIIGNVMGEFILKIFKVTEPISKGLAYGTASHVLGTAKAMEVGEVEGSMSSLSIVVSGILTVALSMLYSHFM